jgi:aspartate/methionine/tyrosine aminotransferase
VQRDLLSDPNALWVEKAKIESEFRANSGRSLVDLAINTIRRPYPAAMVQEFTSRLMRLGEVQDWTQRPDYGYPEETGRLGLRRAIRREFYGAGRELSDGDIYVTSGSQLALFMLANFLSGAASPLLATYYSPSYAALPGSMVKAGFKTIEGPVAQGDFHRIAPLWLWPEHKFQPQFPESSSADIIYLMNPNNPIGVSVTRDSMERLVQAAAESHTLLILDNAYSCFISKENSYNVYDIPRALECVIEVNTFSKLAGLAAMRVGWITVPENTLAPEIVRKFRFDKWLDFFNEAALGVSVASQIAAEVYLDGFSRNDFTGNNSDYGRAAGQLTKLLSDRGYLATGGIDSPLVWLWNPASNDPFGIVRELVHSFGITSNPGIAYTGGVHGYFTDCARLTTMCAQDELDDAIGRLQMI